MPQELLYTQLVKRNINIKFLSLLKTYRKTVPTNLKTIEPNSFSAPRALDKETPLVPYFSNYILTTYSNT